MKKAISLLSLAMSVVMFFLPCVLAAAFEAKATEENVTLPEDETEELPERDVKEKTPVEEKSDDIGKDGIESDGKTPISEEKDDDLPTDGKGDGDDANETDITDTDTKVPQNDEYDTGGSEGAESEPAVHVYISDTDKVCEIGIEDYVIGVVMAEVLSSYGQEALSAQAVAARTFCLYRARVSHSYHGGAEICDDSNHCAAFISYDDAVLSWGKTWADRVYAKVKAAVEETRGIIASYNGEPICAAYFDCAYGVTENCRDVWGGDLSYLVSVETPEARMTKSYRFGFREIYRLYFGEEAPFALSGEPVGEIIYDAAGRVSSCTFYGFVFDGVRLRSALGLRSTDMEIAFSDGYYNISCDGFGHAVGMSQEGAAAYAEMGWGWEDIILHYYTGVTLEKLY